MEPNKLEQEFKNKLEQRTIEPSPMAWDRLDAMLSVGEEKKKPNSTWMYMAASFLVFLMAGVFLLNQEKESGSGTINKGSGIVNEEEPVKKENATGPLRTEEHSATESMTAPQRTENAVATTQTVQKPSGSSSSKKQNSKSASGNIKEKSNVAPINNEGVAAVTNQGIKEMISMPNPDEADKLLAASGDVAHKKKKSIKVDANSLLSSVEGELDESFRDKALQGVVKNFNAVKSSVANRNYQ